MYEQCLIFNVYMYKWCVIPNKSSNYVLTHNRSIILASLDALKGYLHFCSFLHSVLLLQIRLDAATKLHFLEQHGPCVGVQRRLIYIFFAQTNIQAMYFSVKKNGFFLGQTLMKSIWRFCLHSFSCKYNSLHRKLYQCTYSNNQAKPNTRADSS